MLEPTVMTVVKYGSKEWAFQKVDENLLDVLQRNCLRIVLGAWLIDRISNGRLYEKFYSIPLSWATIKERLRRLRHHVGILLFTRPSRAKRKAGHPRLGWKGAIKQDLKEMRTSLEGVKGRL